MYALPWLAMPDYMSPNARPAGQHAVWRSQPMSLCSCDLIPAQEHPYTAKHYNVLRVAVILALRRHVASPHVE